MRLAPLLQIKCVLVCRKSMVFDLGPQRITRTAKTTFYLTPSTTLNTRNNKNIDLT